MNEPTFSYIIRPYHSEDCGSIADAHRRIYTEEYGWNETFCKYSMSIPYAFDAAPKNPRSEMWVAESDGKFAGSIMLKEVDDDPDTAQLRIFVVEKWARKHGIGAALLETLMKKAREAGYKHIFLETCELLTSARRAYKKLGFVLKRTVPVYDWRDDGTPIIDEFWELDL